MNKKFEVKVLNGDKTPTGEVIRCVLRVKSIGNFNPVLCTYRGQDRLVESEALHLDDPFRSSERDHVGKMFIRPRDEDGRVVATWEEAR